MPAKYLYISIDIMSILALAFMCLCIAQNMLVPFNSKTTTLNKQNLGIQETLLSTLCVYPRDLGRYNKLANFYIHQIRLKLKL